MTSLMVPWWTVPILGSSGNGYPAHQQGSSIGVGGTVVIMYDTQHCAIISSSIQIGCLRERHGEHLAKYHTQYQTVERLQSWALHINQWWWLKCFSAVNTNGALFHSMKGFYCALCYTCCFSFKRFSVYKKTCYQGSCSDRNFETTRCNAF